MKVSQSLQCWSKFLRGWVTGTLISVYWWMCLLHLYNHISRDAHSNMETRVSIHSSSSVERCRKQEPEKSVVEVLIISTPPNLAWLFSLGDFEKTLYNMEQVWRSRQWGICWWRARRNTNDQDSLRLMDWNISGVGRINCTPPVLSAWHRPCAVLDWSKEGPSAVVADLLGFPVWRASPCAPGVLTSVCHTWRASAVLKGVNFVLQSFLVFH